MNALVVQRKTAVRRIDEGLRSKKLKNDLDPAAPPTLSDIPCHIERFIDAFGDLLENPRSEQAVQKMVELQSRVLDIREASELDAKLRPTVSLSNALGRSVEALSKLWPTFAHALSAGTMHEARELAREGQKLVDDALGEVSEYQKLVETTAAYEDLSIPDFTDRVLRALSISHPDSSLIELGRVGAKEAENLTGVTCDDAHGAQYLVLNTVAQVHLNPARFRDVLTQAVQLCVGAPRLRAIVEEDGALLGLAASTRLLYESLSSFEAVLLREENEQALMRRVIKFYAELYEDVAGPVMAWYNLLAEVKHQPYLKLVQADVAELARSLKRDRTTEALLERVGSELRNAAQHGNAYSIQGKTVSFHLRSYQAARSQEEILDEVLSLLESLAAMTWALSNVLTRSGFPIPLPAADAEYMRLTPFRLANFWLRDRGTPVLASEEKHSEWKFNMSPGFGDVLQLGLALAMNVPKSVSAVEVASLAEDTQLLLPYAAYVRVSDSQEQGADRSAQLMALLALRAETSKRGQSVLVDSDLKFGTACLGLLLLGGETARVPELRQIQKWAGAANFVEVADVIKQILIGWRTQDPSVVHRLKMRLTLWLNENAAPAVPTTRNIRVLKR